MVVAVASLFCPTNTDGTLSSHQKGALLVDGLLVAICVILALGAHLTYRGVDLGALNQLKEISLDVRMVLMGIAIVDGCLVSFFFITRTTFTHKNYVVINQ